MSNDTEQSPTEFTKAALAAHRQRWRDTLRSRVFWRAFFCGIGTTFSPNSPLGPGMGGMLAVLLTVLVGLIIGPIVMRATIWWWSLWLSFP